MWSPLDAHVVAVPCGYGWISIKTGVVPMRPFCAPVTGWTRALACFVRVWVLMLTVRLWPVQLHGLESRIAAPVHTRRAGTLVAGLYAHLQTGQSVHVSAQMFTVGRISSGPKLFRRDHLSTLKNG
jgi:hypothetical protein